MNDQYTSHEPYNPPPIDNTASYGKRFGAFLLDTLFMLIAFTLLIQHFGLIEMDPANTQDAQALQAQMLTKISALPNSQKTLILFFPYISFLVLHGFLLHQSGQTLGKRIMGIAIVTMDNRKPEFFPLITQRYVTQWIVGVVPLVGPLLRMLDIVAIFRPDRRCIHDHLAKTKVIDLRIPVNHVQAPTNSLIV